MPLDDTPITVRTLTLYVAIALGTATAVTSSVWFAATTSARLGTVERDNESQTRDIARNAARIETQAATVNDIDKKLGVISYQLEQLGARPPAGK